MNGENYQVKQEVYFTKNNRLEIQISNSTLERIELIFNTMVNVIKIIY